jgi:hypothetical protein
VTQLFIGNLEDKTKWPSTSVQFCVRIDGISSKKGLQHQPFFPIYIGIFKVYRPVVSSDFFFNGLFYGNNLTLAYWKFPDALKFRKKKNYWASFVYPLNMSHTSSKAFGVSVADSPKAKKITLF